MTEKVNTVIECHFLLPDFKSRGHPNLDATELQQLHFQMMQQDHSCSISIQRETPFLPPKTYCFSNLPSHSETFLKRFFYWGNFDGENGMVLLSGENGISRYQGLVSILYTV